MDEQELYDLVCNKRFDKIDKNLDKITDLLKGKNGNAGLVDDVRGLKNVNRYVLAAIVFILSTISIQFIHWLFTKI